MKVLNVCHTDWSNFAYDNMMALLSVGVECTGIVAKIHPFGYDQSLPAGTFADIIDEINKCDTVQFFHDNASLFTSLVPFMRGKKKIVYHTSSYYRKNFELVNAAMNPWVYRSVCAMPEFIGKGAKNEVYMVGAIDTDGLRPNKYNVSKTFRFAHYPSNPKVKGTDKIIEMMRGLKAQFTYSIEQASYNGQLVRMSGCDIYIEMFTETDGNGMPYGNFGITALEAAAMGKLVITNCKGIVTYMETYGKPFFYIADDEEQFRFAVNTMLKAPAKKIAELQQEKQKLVHMKHGYKASGEYILSHVL